MYCPPGPEAVHVQRYEGRPARPANQLGVSADVLSGPGWEGMESSPCATVAPVDDAVPAYTTTMEVANSKYAEQHSGRSLLCFTGCFSVRVARDATNKRSL